LLEKMKARLVVGVSIALVVGVAVTLAVVLTLNRTKDKKVDRQYAETDHVVAVYDHVYISGPATSRDEALRIMRANADIFGHQMSLAKSKVYL